MVVLSKYDIAEKQGSAWGPELPLVRYVRRWSYEDSFEWLYYILLFSENPSDYSTITAIGLDNQDSNTYSIV